MSGLYCYNKPKMEEPYMARAMTKADLQISAEEQFTELWILIDGLDEVMQNAVFQFADRDRNIRDVLVHLYEWHQLLIQWLTSNLAGVERSFLPEPYNWRTYPKMNQEIWEKHQITTLAEAKTLLKGSHESVMKLIDERSNEELYSKGVYKWSKTTAIGSYMVSNTASHYVWAIKKIKKHIKTFAKK